MFFLQGLIESVQYFIPDDSLIVPLDGTHLLVFQINCLALLNGTAEMLNK